MYFNKRNKRTLLEAGENGIESWDEYQDSKKAEQDGAGKESEEKVNDGHTIQKEDEPSSSNDGGASEVKSTGKGSIFNKAQENMIKNGPKDFDAKAEKDKIEEMRKNNAEPDIIKDSEARLEEAEFMDKSSPKQRALHFLSTGQSDVFPNYKDYGKAFKGALYGSLSKNGWTTETNPFLLFASRVANTDVVKVKPNATTALYEIGVMIGENQLEVNGDTLSWLKNPSSYEADDPEYKIKALAFLSGPDADRYGELDLVPQLIKKIVQEKKSINIKVMLSDWQTKEGDNKPSSEGKAPQTDSEKAKADKIFKSLLSTFNRGKVKYDAKKAREVFDKYYRVGDTVDEIALAVIENGGVASS